MTFDEWFEFTFADNWYPINHNFDAETSAKVKNLMRMAWEVAYEEGREYEHEFYVSQDSSY